MSVIRDRLIKQGCYNYEWDLKDVNQQIEDMDLNRDELDAKLEYLRRKEKINEQNDPEVDPFNGNVLLYDMSETFSNCLSTAVRKNHDYGGSNNDPYANFRNSTIAGVSVERGILVRLMDKMSRIATLLDKENMVKEESITDTIDDAINYLAILKSYRKQNK